MRALAAAASGVEAAIHFVPQSGPFARGIYATLQARLAAVPCGPRRCREALAGFYAASPFVDVLAEPPRLQDVVGTNRAASPWPPTAITWWSSPPSTTW